MRAAVPIRIRRRAKPFRLIARKASRFIAWKPRHGRQESTKETDRELARAFAHRRIAETRPDLAVELGIATTPPLPGLKQSGQSTSQAAA